MRCKTTKLYPFSMKNAAIIKAYSEKLDNMIDETTDFESNIWKESIKVGALLFRIDEHYDGKVAWLSGTDIALAKKIIAVA